MSVKTFLKRRTVDFNIFFCFLTNSIVINRDSAWVRYGLPIETFCLFDTSTLPSDTIIIKFLRNTESLWLLF